MITLMDKYTIIKLKQTGMSNRQVAKQLGLNRKTVNKYSEEIDNALDLILESEKEKLRLLSEINNVIRF